jgi:hypothetical protein
MIEWKNSDLWFKLSRICYAKTLTQALPNLILEAMIWQFVKHCVIVVTFALYLHILDSSRCLGEKGWTFRKSKTSLWVHVIFLSSKCSSFFTQRFLYLFCCCGPWCGGGLIFWPRFVYEQANTMMQLVNGKIWLYLTGIYAEKETRLRKGQSFSQNLQSFTHKTLFFVTFSWPL